MKPTSPTVLAFRKVGAASVTSSGRVFAFPGSCRVDSGFRNRLPPAPHPPHNESSSPPALPTFAFEVPDSSKIKMAVWLVTRDNLAYPGPGPVPGVEAAVELERPECIGWQLKRMFTV